MQNIHIWKKVSKVQILSPSDIELSYFVTFWSSGGCRNGEMKKKKKKKVCKRENGPNNRPILNFIRRGILSRQNGAVFLSLMKRGVDKKLKMHQ